MCREAAAEKPSWRTRDEKCLRASDSNRYESHPADTPAHCSGASSSNMYKKKRKPARGPMLVKLANPPSYLLVGRVLDYPSLSPNRSEGGRRASWGRERATGKRKTGACSMCGSHSHPAEERRERPFQRIAFPSRKPAPCVTGKSRSTVSDHQRPGASPALYSPQAGVFCRPAAHGVVGGLEAIVDGLVRDLRQLLKARVCQLSRSLYRENTAWSGWATYVPQLLITRAKLLSVRQARPAPLKYPGPGLGPLLRGSLPEIDLLALVTAGVRVEEDPEGSV